MRIPAPHGSLEAALREPDGPPRGAAVVCHPHPLHGGTMHTKAVFRTAQALSEVDVLALRFNFRGVGTSTGEHAGGEGEREDVRAALDWLEEREPDLPLLVAGFSFGSMVGLRVGAEDDRVRGMIGLGVPVDLYDLDWLATVRKPLLVVQGERDEFGPANRVEEALSGSGEHVRVVRIAGADHYFHDRFDDLKGAVRGWLLEGPGSDVLRGSDGAGGVPTDRDDREEVGR